MMVNGFAPLTGVQIFVVKVGRGGGWSGVLFHFGDTRGQQTPLLDGARGGGLALKQGDRHVTGLP